MTHRITPLSTTTRLKRNELVDIINEAIDEINNIHSLYERFFAEEGGAPSYLTEIETRLHAISDQYVELFENHPTSMVSEIEQAMGDIKAYHKELLTADNSIKSDIDESQERITDFYHELFTSSDSGVTQDGGQQALVEAAIKSITDFNTRLNNATNGYKFSIEKAKDEILKAHEELFKKNKATAKSAIDQLNEEIAETHNMHDTIKNSIVPFMGEQQTEIASIAQDIKSKQGEIDSLLSNATVRALAQGYAESMQTYGSPIVRSFPPKGDWRHRTWFVFSTSWSQFKYFLKFLGSYILFIGPLFIIGALFVVNNNSIFGIDLTTKDVHFSGQEYVLYKLTIALPLLWVSWFGQRSIAHRKRLFEEYNHKLRVVQMYMLFTAQKNTYALSPEAMSRLETELLDTIARNPSHVYGKDETMIDRLMDVFGGRQLIKKSKKDKSVRDAA